MRQCSSCQQLKDDSCFYKNPNSYQCKACQSAQQKAYRQNLSQDKKDKLTLSFRRYAENNREKIRIKSRKYISRKDVRERHDFLLDPVKKRAGELLRNAVHAGKIVKPDSCQECGQAGMIHGHHADYSKPMSVEWLCGICHGKRHRKHIIDAAQLKGEK